MYPLALAVNYDRLINRRTDGKLYFQKWTLINDWHLSYSYYPLSLSQGNVYKTRNKPYERIYDMKTIWIFYIWDRVLNIFFTNSEIRKTIGIKWLFWSCDQVNEGMGEEVSYWVALVKKMSFEIWIRFWV